MIDGWDGAEAGSIALRSNGAPVTIEVAPYREFGAISNPSCPGHGGVFVIDHESRPYTSYVHVGSHLAAAYSTSPFARRNEPSMVLVWDGGCFPRLYYVDGDGRI